MKQPLPDSKDEAYWCAVYGTVLMKPGTPRVGTAQGEYLLIPCYFGPDFPSLGWEDAAEQI